MILRNDFLSLNSMLYEAPIYSSSNFPTSETTQFRSKSLNQRLLLVSQLYIPVNSNFSSLFNLK